jgi:hypothetical protein
MDRRTACQLFTINFFSLGSMVLFPAAPVQMPITWDENVLDENQEEVISRGVVIKMAGPEEMSSLEKDLAGS